MKWNINNISSFCQNQNWKNWNMGIYCLFSWSQLYKRSRIKLQLTNDSICDIDQFYLGLFHFCELIRPVKKRSTNSYRINSQDSITLHPLKVCSNRTKWFFTPYKNQSASQVNVHVSYTFAEKPWPRLLAVLLEVNILGLESGLKTSHPLKIFSNPTKYRFLFFSSNGNKHSASKSKCFLYT